MKMFAVVIGLMFSSSVFALPGGTKSVGAVPIAREGKALMDIVVASAEAIPAEKTAAKELATYLEKITGAAFAIVDETNATAGTPGIYVGNTRFAREQGIAVGSLGEEESVLRTVGNRIILSGGRPRGSLYAVYGLLEDELGCRWYTPWCEKTPRQENCAVPALDRRGAPRFRLREIGAGFMDPRIYADQEQWRWFVARNRMNGPSMGGKEDVGGCIGILINHNHSLNLLVPEKEYFKDHPEYFSLRNGKRVPPPGGVGEQLCLTHPDVLRIIVAKVKEEFRKHPDAKIASVSQNDGGNQNLCDCDKCRAIAGRYGGDGGLMLWFVNQVADGIIAEFPDRFILTLVGYGPTARPPLGLVGRDNVIGWCCSGFDSGYVALQTPIGYGGTMEDFDGWASCVKRMWVWDYGINHNVPINYFCPTIWKLNRQFKLLGAMPNAEGFFQDGSVMTGGGGITDMGEMKLWLDMKLCENPVRKLDELVRDFIGGYYGPAAPSLLGYLALVEGDLGNWPYRMLTFDFMRQAQKCFDNAERAARKCPEELARVREWRSNLDLAALNLRHQLTRDYLRQGGRLEKYPYPAPLLRDRIVKTMQETKNPYLLSRWPMPDGSWMPARDQAILYARRVARGKSFAALPAELVALPSDRIIDLMPEQILSSGLRADNTNPGGFSIVEDAESALGVALMKPGDKELPFVIGAYDVHSKISSATTVYPGRTELIGPGYHFYKLSFPMQPGTYVYVTKDWILQAWAYMLYDTAAPRAEWEAWVSAKFTGPAYMDGPAAATNAVYVDRILLVRDDIWKDAGSE